MPRTRQAKPEKDQATTEIAAQQEAEGASVTDGEGRDEKIEAMAEAIAEVDSVTGDQEGVVTHEIAGVEVSDEDNAIDLIDAALSELGEPDGSYPAPVVNAISLLRSAQAALQAGGVEVVGTLEMAEEVEVFSPGQKVPESGLYRPVGSESALSKDDRFPPPSMAFGWVLFEQADQEVGS